MNDTLLLWIGIFCFLMAALGIAFTIVEFRQHILTQGKDIDRKP